MKREAGMDDEVLQFVNMRLSIDKHLTQVHFILTILSIYVIWGSKLMAELVHLLPLSLS